MSAIYNIDFSLAAERLSPPRKRKTVYLAWLKVLLFPLQWLRNFIFANYAYGINPQYIGSTQYFAGDIVKFDGLVYTNISETGGSIGVPPVDYSGALPVSNTSTWMLLLDTDIGLRERLKYNGQTIVLQGILNKVITGNVEPDPFVQILNVSNDRLNVFFYNQNESSNLKNAPRFNNVPNNSTPLNEYFELAVVMYNEPEYTFSDDFIVEVPKEYYRAVPSQPASLPINVKNNNLLITYIEKYKIVGTSYSIREKA